MASPSVFAAPPIPTSRHRPLLREPVRRAAPFSRRCCDATNRQTSLQFHLFLSCSHAHAALACSCHSPLRPEQLPLSRAIRGEEVEDTEVFIRNQRRPSALWLCVTARPLRDEFGTVRGGLSVFRDITEEKLANQRLSAQHAVTRALAESASLGEATPRILQVICASAGWELGALWQVDREANLLHCVDVWHRPDMGVQEFETVTRQTPF